MQEHCPACGKGAAGGLILVQLLQRPFLKATVRVHQLSPGPQAVWCGSTEAGDRLWRGEVVCCIITKVKIERFGANTAGFQYGKGIQGNMNFQRFPVLRGF